MVQFGESLKLLDATACKFENKSTKKADKKQADRNKSTTLEFINSRS